MLVRPNLKGSPQSRPAPPLARGWDEIGPLCVLCDQGRLYEVEEWIAKGLPIQCVPPTDRKLRWLMSPLQMAAHRGFHSLAELLLLNGYDPNGDSWTCLAPALKTRNRSMLELLLKHVADPHGVEFEDVLETYDRGIMDLFIAAGVDPCRDHTVARVLLHKKRPHLGFIKQYGDRFPGLLRQAAIALKRFVSQQDQKGVSLMLCVGASPHLAVPDLDDDPETEESGWDSALGSAAWRSDPVILKMLLRVPILPERIQSLFRETDFNCCPEITAKLLQLGADPNQLDNGRHVLDSMIRTATWSFGFANDKERQAKALECIRLVAAAGARWDPDPEDITSLRRTMISGPPETVRAIIEVLREKQVLAEAHLHDLTRTPAMRQLLALGAAKQRRAADPRTRSARPAAVTLTPSSGRAGYWKKHWSR